MIYPVFKYPDNMMLISSKVVPTRKHQENVPNEDERHRFQYNALENCLYKNETVPKGIECVVRGEGRVVSTDEINVAYRHANLPFIIH